MGPVTFGGVDWRRLTGRHDELRRYAAGDTTIQTDGGGITTIYDVLRKLIAGEPWTEEDRRAAYALVGELEAVNLLGNVATQVTTTEGRERV